MVLIKELADAPEGDRGENNFAGFEWFVSSINGG
jgi:hypothetical protein